jgi:hypothetical protein
VPVPAPNYKQRILSPAKFRKVCYSLPELYVKSVYLNLFGWREREHFMGGVINKRLRTFGIDVKIQNRSKQL